MPPKSQPARPTNPIFTAYFSFRTSGSVDLTSSLQLTQLPRPCNSLNFAPGRHLSAEKAGKNWEGCLQPGSRRWRQFMASTLSSHQPLLTEKTEPPLWCPQCQEADLLHLLLIATSAGRKDFRSNASDPTDFSLLFSGPITHNPCITWGWSHSEAPM